MGLAPEMLPGRTSLGAGRSWFADKWGSLPSSDGLDATGILNAAASGDIAVLFLLGSDPLADFADPDLAQAALDGADLVIAVDPFINASSAAGADIVLPAAAIGEIDGSHTNLEGRISPIRQKVTPPGTARPDWMIAAEIAMRLGKDMGFTSVTEITNEIAAVSGIHAGATADAIEAAADGVLIGEAEAGRPAPFEWTDLGEPTPAPAYDSYSFRLVVDRTMYDGGTQTAMCESIADQADDGAVRLHPTEAARLGVAKGDTVRLTSPKASIQGPVAVDDRVAPGIAAVAHNHAGVDARALIDIGALVTDVRIETV